MRARKFVGVAIAAVMATTLAACGGGGDEGSDVEVDKGAEFEAGTTMAKLNEAGKITVGVKYDQPGLGYKNPATGELEGLDIEIAKIVAGKLGIDPENIEWVETVSANRETFIQKGTVDIVVASYSITDERKQVVDFAGPYYVTGQQLLIREDDGSIKEPEDLTGKSVCSAKGSTSIKTVEEKFGASPKPFDTYTECVQQLLNGSVDAVTTDGAILLGYAAQQPDKLKVVGREFSVEKYGIGLKKGDDAFRKFLNDTIQESFENGKWKAAFENTLGKSGVEVPEPPKLERY